MALPEKWDRPLMGGQTHFSGKVDLNPIGPRLQQEQSSLRQTRFP